MAVKLNNTGYSHAKSLIKAGKVDKDSSWSFTTEDENKILGDNNWKEYKKWFLAIDDETNEETKAHYKFPFGKNGKVYRRGVIAAKQRAAQQGYTDIVNAADNLLQEIDGKEDKSHPPTNTRFNRTFGLDVREGGILDAENRIVELSFSSEEPIRRWFGTEVLLHDSNAVDLTPFENVGAVLLNHNPDNIIGKPIKVWLDNETRKGKAIVQFANTDEGKKAFENVKEGVLRGVSVGYIVDKWKLLDENEQWDRFEGPLDIATKWRVLEVSLTPIPADASVGVGRTQEIKEEKNMEKQEVTKERTNVEATVDIEALAREAAEKERERIKEIESLCRIVGSRAHMDLTDFGEELIQKGVSLDEASKLIIKKLGEQPESKPVTQTHRVEMGESAREKIRDAMIEGLLARTGLVKNAKPNKFTDMSLVDIAKESLRAVNLSAEGSPSQILDMAIGKRGMATTSDFPIILENVMNKVVLEGFNEIPATWKEWCDTGAVSNYDVHTFVSPGEMGEVELVREGAEYKYISYTDGIKEQVQVEKYGGLFPITKEALKNDTTGFLSTANTMKELGQSLKNKINEEVYNVLISNPKMGDGKSLFCSDHKNVASSGSDITIDAIEAAYTAMQLQKNSRGKILNIKPQFIIVPSSKGLSTEKLLSAEFLDHPGGTKNVVGTLTVIADGSLDEAGTAWYLAGPKGKTVRVFFLDGVQVPTIKSWVDEKVDGVVYKISLAFKAKALSWKALYKNPGV